MSDKRIFISCGQASEPEKMTGILFKTLVDAEPGFSAYFAETVHDLEALAQHVLKGLQECSGAIVVLQDRGRVLHSDNTKWGHRSSVWVNQEVAILAYRQFFEATHLPVLAFVDPRVKLEGAMTALIVNPQPLPPMSQLQTAVTAWLRSSSFAESAQAGFLAKWEQLPDSARRVVCALVDEGGLGVKESSIRRILTGKFGLDPNAASDQLQQAKLHFMNTDLVKLIPNIHSGAELSLNPTWQFALRRQCAAWSHSTGMPHR